jgi:drug/metabolite transporter (DMT)-like permease
MTKPSPLDWLAIALLGLVWGGTFMVISFALQGYGPLTVACARTTFGAVTLLAVLALSGKALPKGWAIWRFILPAGLLSTALPFFLLSWAQGSVASAFAGLSMASVPLFVLPLAHVFSDEPMRPRKLFGFGLGFAGVALVLGPEAFGAGQALLPRGACFAAALCYAVSSILTRRCPKVDPIAFAAATLIVGAAVLIPAMLLFEGLPHWAGPQASGAIVFLGLVPTALAALLRVSTIRRVGSGFMTLTNYQVPLWSMGFGTLILGEALPPTFFAALVLILSGMAVSQSGRAKVKIP